MWIYLFLVGGGGDLLQSSLFVWLLLDLADNELIIIPRGNQPNIGGFLRLTFCLPLAIDEYHSIAQFKL